MLERGWGSSLITFPHCFSLHFIGLSGPAASDYQLMKAVAEEMRLSPLSRQQQLARLADDIQRYGRVLLRLHVLQGRPTAECIGLKDLCHTTFLMKCLILLTQNKAAVN